MTRLADVDASYLSRERENAARPNVPKAIRRRRARDARRIYIERRNLLRPVAQGAKRLGMVSLGPESRDTTRKLSAPVGHRSVTRQRTIQQNVRKNTTSCQRDAP
jgi:hypothetical protein